MELIDLVGEHLLSGVDFSTESIETWDHHFENCQVINFVLDGITYIASEDPDDGYRSSMREIVVSDYVVSNRFPAIRVMGKMRDPGAYENDVIELYDIKNGKLVLAVGTGDTNDYYPYWVAEFIPENMSINISRE